LNSDVLVRESDVSSLEAFGAFFNAKLNSLAFFKIAVAVALDCGEMDENVLPILAFDKAVAFAAVKPFDRADDSF
jgi:hypothetical protein